MSLVSVVIVAEDDSVEVVWLLSLAQPASEMSMSAATLERTQVVGRMVVFVIW
jgi:hypothetical protein